MRSCLKFSIGLILGVFTALVVHYAVWSYGFIYKTRAVEEMTVELRNKQTIIDRQVGMMAYYRVIPPIRNKEGKILVFNPDGTLRGSMNEQDYAQQMQRDGVPTGMNVPQPPAMEDVPKQVQEATTQLFEEGTTPTAQRMPYPYGM